MPQEIVLVLLIVGAVIWLVVKVCQAIAEGIEQATKNYNEAAARRKADRDAQKRDILRQYIHFLIPNDLDKFEMKFNATQLEFDEVQRFTNWVARPLGWVKVEFHPVTSRSKDGSYGEMCIEDINAILNPDSDSSTWSFNESEILSRQCKYPSRPPAGNFDNFKPFATLNVDLKIAVFEFDGTNISKKDADRYFSGDQSGVLAYNTRRADLIARTTSLNAAIQEWNGKNRSSWEKYVAESKELEGKELVAFQRASDLYIKACNQEKDHFKGLLEGYKKREKQSVIERLNYVLSKIKFPDSVPHTWEVDFDEEQNIGVIEIKLPDVVHQPPYKTVDLKSGAVKKPLNQTEKKELIPKVHPAILLRTVYEVFRNDAGGSIDLLVVNGWVQFDDPATGKNTKAYTASLMVTRAQVTALNLAKIDPIVAFNNLHGKSAGKLIEIIPIEPVLSLNRTDSRFVNAKEVLKGLGPETNLAAMDWQDFEHLIRELFEKEFSGRGAEVKITQASRDRGVDAIVFDPDPIHGGKYVIQAKRYTNTVDVSAVRDLCAVVQKEGASRGILVTTSTYGADAYAFANNEPVTLLNGAELLGLLKKHGYSFRINIQEARRLI